MWISPVLARLVLFLVLFYYPTGDPQFLATSTPWKPMGVGGAKIWRCFCRVARDSWPWPGASARPSEFPFGARVCMSRGRVVSIGSVGTVGPQWSRVEGDQGLMSCYLGMVGPQWSRVEGDHMLFSSTFFISRPQ